MNSGCSNYKTPRILKMCKSFSIAEIVMSCRARHFVDLFRVVYKALRINLSLFFKASPTHLFILEITFHESHQDIFFA